MWNLISFGHVLELDYSMRIMSNSLTTSPPLSTTLLQRKWGKNISGHEGTEVVMLGENGAVDGENGNGCVVEKGLRM